MYIEAQYNAGMPNKKEFEEIFKARLVSEFADAEIVVYADGCPSIVVLDVDDEDEKERVKFRVIDIRKECKMTRKEWRTW